MQPAGSTSTGSAAAVVVVLAVLAASAACCRGQLVNDYYAGKCGNESVEGIILSAVKDRLAVDQRLVAGFLHMLFHDCFVAGCDASLLLDGPASEKTAPQNSGIFGYDHIDYIKSVLEATCPAVVSCADIVVAATRDAVALAGGPSYQVQTGRLDGKSSMSWMATDLPAPNVDIPTAITMFAKKGLNSFDMAILMGAHTVGVTHCSVIKDRLRNFNGTGAADPSMDPVYVYIMTTFACPENQTFDNIVYLDDPSSILTVDKSYYNQIMKRRGVLAVDQALGDSAATSWMVHFLATTDFFPSLLSYALNKLAAVEVKTGADGEVRRNCRATN